MMVKSDAPRWRERAGTSFSTEKEPVAGTQGVIAASHPLASAAGLQMLADGGNAVDAAIASLFTSSVVEPMMVGIFGAGWMNIQLADGKQVCIDNYSRAPAAATPELFRPISDVWPDYMKTVDRANEIGHLAAGVPGSLRAWCDVADRWGRLGLPALMQPAILHAEHGFRVSEYLSSLIKRSSPELSRCPQASAVFLPEGHPLEEGDRLQQPNLAESFRTIAAEGADALYGGELGQRIVDAIQTHGGVMTLADLQGYRIAERPPLTGSYRGYDITVPALPSSGGLHLLQMLQILEGYDVARLGYGTTDSFHLLAEACKIAFADRQEHAGDPEIAPVPVDWLLSGDYLASRRSEIDMHRAGWPRAGVPLAESANTTHVTVADCDGNVVSMTQTINAVFGAKVIAGDTGILLNNTMSLFDPHPRRANSVGPGKAMTSSMSPAIVTKNGTPVFALGSPGGVRIFASVAQAIMNVIDHGMSLQEAIEAPRIWTQGQALEVEVGVPERIRVELSRRGHDIAPVTNIGGGMNGVDLSQSDRGIVGSSCWRGDGAPAALSGGMARRGIRFTTTAK